MLRAVAADQLGLIGLDQLRAMCVTRSALAYAVRSGFLAHAGHRLYRIAGSGESRDQRLRRAVLDAGGDAALSHLAAAHAWKMSRRAAPAEVVRTAAARWSETRSPGCIGCAICEPSHVVVLDGLRITTPARTVMDLAACVPLGQVARALDRAWGQRLLTIGSLAGVLAQVRTQGRRGVRTIETLIDERRGHVPTESALEQRFAVLAQQSGFGPLRRQVDVSDHEGWIGRVDFAHDDLGLVIFVDGDAWHRAITQRIDDDVQTTRLEAAGLKVVRFSELAVLYEAPTLADRLRVLSASGRRMAA